MSVIRIDAHRARVRVRAEQAERFALDGTGVGRWRILDRRMPLGHPFRVLALIDADFDGHRVLLLGRGFSWTAVASMEAAIAHVVLASTALARVRAGLDDAEPVARAPRVPLRALPPHAGTEAD